NAHAYARALSALILAAAGHLEEALCEMRLVHNLRPGLRIDDVLSSFRLLKDQDRAFRSIARQIGMSYLNQRTAEPDLTTTVHLEQRSNGAASCSSMMSAEGGVGIFGTYDTDSG